MATGLSFAVDNAPTPRILTADSPGLPGAAVDDALHSEQRCYVRRHCHSFDDRWQRYPATGSRAGDGS